MHDWQVIHRLKRDPMVNNMPEAKAARTWTHYWSGSTQIASDL
jgi:hypothetical protein